MLTRTWTAKDNCGNSTLATQTITVQDNQAPTFGNVPQNTTIECSQPVPTVTNPTADITVVCAPNCVPTPINPTASDNCGSASVTYQGQTQTPGDCTTGYTVTRTWKATDLCGLMSTHTQTITVLPAPPPAAPEGTGGPSGVTTSTNKPTDLRDFRPRPNPTEDWVTIELDNFQGENVQVSVFNNQGQLVVEQKLHPVSSPVYELSLRKANLPDGLYQVVVESGGRRYAKQLVLAR